jgi:putative transcriptional regulator
MGKAFDDIMAGLQDALAYAQGDSGRGRDTVVSVPDVDVRAARHRLGMTQPVFARTFGVSVATVRNWEQRRRRPEGAARVLLRVIEMNPTAVLQAIRGTAGEG